MGSHQPIRKSVTPEPPVIPDKLYFRIGDVAKLCGVEPYVLRFWQTEFPSLKPHKGGTGQRLYRRKDVEMALRIKGLLYDQGYTIPGARIALKTEPTSAPSVSQNEPAGLHLTVAAKPAPSKQLSALRDELQALATQLAQPVGAAKPKLKPRLVLEPKPVPEPKSAKLHAMKPRLEQGDLFGGE
jgi:DNA-binding transcriptional MerR regulator